MVNGQIILYFRLFDIFVIHHFDVYKIIDLHSPGKAPAMIQAIGFNGGQKFF